MLVLSAALFFLYMGIFLLYESERECYNKLETTN